MQTQVLSFCRSYADLGGSDTEQCAQSEAMLDQEAEPGTKDSVVTKS